MFQMSIDSFVSRVYGVELKAYSLGYCHKYPEFLGKYDKEVQKILPHVKRNEIIEAVKYCLNKNYRADYDTAFYEELKGKIENKIRHDFQEVWKVLLLSPSYIGIDFEKDIIEFEHVSDLQKSVLAVINKAYDTNYKWGDYCGDWLKAMRKRQSPFLKNKYRVSEKTVLIKLLGYLREWEKYFPTEGGNLFKFDISKIKPKVKERYTVDEIVEYLKKISVNAHAGTRHYGGRIQAVLNVAKREREAKIKKQKAKERRKYLRTLHKTNKNV